MAESEEGEEGERQVKFGEGWYLFRCRRCRQAFVATALAEWCDCGNTHFRSAAFRTYGSSKDVIVIESVIPVGAEGCIVTWDHRRVEGFWGWWDP